MRVIHRNYIEPLELIWGQAAEALGIEIRRSTEVFASWDGERILTLGTAETLDRDDTLAQMFFHECCHAIIEGPERFHLVDWGLDQDRPQDLVREQATLCLQAHWAQQHDLRDFLAATTDFRSYYDALPPEPLSSAAGPAAELARVAWQNLPQSAWFQPLEQALKRTRILRQLLAPWSPANSLWYRTPGP